MPFYKLFLGEGSPTKLDYREKIGYHYSNLFTGGPRQTIDKNIGNSVERLSPAQEVPLLL